MQQLRYRVTRVTRFHKLKLKLPSSLTCTQCVLQWKYNTGYSHLLLRVCVCTIAVVHTGNSWGYDEEGLGCLGCGRQEQFYACSDISIASNHTTASPAEAIRPAQLGSRVTGSMLIAWLLNVLKPNITISEVW